MAMLNKANELDDSVETTDDVIETDVNTDESGLSDEDIGFIEKVINKFKKGDKLKELIAGEDIKSKTFIKEIKPKRKYVFHSDYFEIDDKYACILAYNHPDVALDKFGPFWGVNRVAINIPEGIQLISFENIMRYSEGWISKHQQVTDEILKSNTFESNKSGGGTSNALKNNSRQQQLMDIANELNGGASYLGVMYKTLIKADSLEILDAFIEKVNDTFSERMGTIGIGAYDACQRGEFESLLRHPSKQKGKTFDFTSVEYAGSYALLTTGLNDPAGEYVGVMSDDVNNAAILFDVDNYNHHVVIANDQFENTKIRNPIAGYWGSKLSQATMLHDNRVVHFIFDGTDMDTLGPKFDGITARINMDKGDINMFEMFGDPGIDDEFSIFSEQQQKISLMIEQVYPLTEEQRGVTLGTLKEIVEQYYIDQRMWFKDAKAHKNRLRILGLDHNVYPDLALFSAYIAKEHKAANAADPPDIQRIEALGILRTAFNEMLSVNGDLFNTKTNPEMDKVITARRALYDFSSLYLRNKALAQAQFVNILGYAIRRLKAGDLIVIHGVEYIDDRIKEFVDTQFTAAFRRGARVAYIYDSIDKSFNDNAFSRIDQADYTIYGPYTPTQIDLYQKILNQPIPAAMRRNLTKKGLTRTYIRRGGRNVLFNMDLVLGAPTALFKGGHT